MYTCRSCYRKSHLHDNLLPFVFHVDVTRTLSLVEETIQVLKGISLPCDFIFSLVWCHKLDLL